jgi:hypothetical protein
MARNASAPAGARSRICRRLIGAQTNIQRNLASPVRFQGRQCRRTATASRCVRGRPSLLRRHEVEILPPWQRSVGERLLPLVGGVEDVVADIIKQPPYLAAGHLELR